MLSLLVWLMFGVIAVVPALQSLTWQAVLYAVLSLTVIRMLPVAVALAKRYGPRLTPPPQAAGPAGLAEIPERRLIRRSPAVSQPGIPRRG